MTLIAVNFLRVIFACQRRKRDRTLSNVSDSPIYKGKNNNNKREQNREVTSATRDAVFVQKVLLIYYIAC